MRKLIIMLLLVGVGFSLHAQTPTWSNGVACIIYTHCSSCHNSKGIAPFSLISYQDAVNNKTGIVSDVSNGAMPPYPPDRTYQHYAAERYLTDKEINTLTQWVALGTPLGDTMQAPAKPVFNQVVEIPAPDFSATMTPYTVPSMTSDLYRCFIISNPFAVDRFVSGIEVIPGDRSAVHHVLMFQDSSNAPVSLDNADPNPGYTSFGGIGSNSARLVVGWVPGSRASFFPPGMAIRITAGSRLIIQVHYPLGSSGKTDSTKVNLQFSKAAGLRDIIIAPILNHSTTLTDGPLAIPANTVKTFHAKYTIPINATLLTVGPHAHLLCQSMKVYAVKAGHDTVPIIKINDWDFHWQGGYSFRKPIYLPAGSTLYGEATYDNTTNNPDNPNSPPKLVTLGESTTNEMMLFYFNFLGYVPGDENIIVDTASAIAMYNNCSFVQGPSAAIATVSDNSAFKVYPNPASTQLNIELPAGVNNGLLQVYNLMGSVLINRQMNQHADTLDVSALMPGIYMLRVTTGSDNVTETIKFVKQ